VEEELLRAGCSADFAHGITAPLERYLLAHASHELYPAATYYYLVREAAIRRDKESAGLELAGAYRSGVIEDLIGLPVETRPAAVPAR
jgi:hypothetical protein